MTQPYHHDPLWRQIEAYVLPGGHHGETFVTRLARDNDWTLAQARKVIAEYRRFCYLAARSGQPVAPSSAVDRARHKPAKRPAACALSIARRIGSSASRAWAALPRPLPAFRSLVPSAAAKFSASTYPATPKCYG